MNENSESQSACRYQGKHLEFHVEQGWEYVSRVNATGVVGIIAVTTGDQIVLVEQPRLPLASRILELPAGLVGDELAETFEEAARRELLEETGYAAESLTSLFSGPSSAGLTDEVVQIIRAEGLSRTHSGGGVGGESITVHTIPLETIETFIDAFEDSGGMVDFKVRLAVLLVKGSS